MAELAQVFDLRQSNGASSKLALLEVLYICLSEANRGKFAAMNFECAERSLMPRRVNEITTRLGNDIIKKD